MRGTALDSFYSCFYVAARDLFCQDFGFKGEKLASNSDWAFGFGQYR
ncbi:unnamed protein product [Acidithrix sp. C25]|nr:unnamed protein product [Acidithrix sp. C25]